VTGELKRGERVDALAKVKAGIWIRPRRRTASPFSPAGKWCIFRDSRHRGRAEVPRIQPAATVPAAGAYIFWATAALFLRRH
jgi:hypothetical protein